MGPPPRVAQYTGAFSADAVAAMRAALANSALVGPSVLGGGFAATRGFAVMFLAEGRARLAQLAPALVPFVDAATAGDGCSASPRGASLRGGQDTYRPHRRKSREVYSVTPTLG